MNIQSKIKEELCSRGKTLSVAESCTGGRISHLLTTIPGSSQYYKGSVTSYAIEIKEKILSVPAETIDKYGVVSSEVAKAMAEGVKGALNTDYSVATTGLAGPGGDADNPEGIVWIGVCGPGISRTICKRVEGSRIQNIRNFTNLALKELYKLILEDK